MVALTDTQLHRLLDNKEIVHCDGIDLNEYVQPASIDLPVGTSLYHVQQKFLPFQETIREKIETVSTQELSTEGWIVLYKWQTYLIPCLEVALWPKHSWKISPKSSLGRIDVLIRALVDNTGLYDTVPSSTQWELRLEVTPQSFNITIHTGNALSQLMIFEDQGGDFENKEESFENKEEDFENDTAIPEKALADTQFLFSDNGPIQPAYYDDKLIVWLWIANNGIVWYKARFTNKIIDISNIWMYDWQDFFEPVYPTQYRWDQPQSDSIGNNDAGNNAGNGHSITLEQGRFYILPTKEKIRVPDAYSIELIPFTHLMGELRVHYAGFFDPWFWWAQWSTGVLEIRPHEDTTITHWQPICMMKIYTNKTLPAQSYGSKNNNYQWQSWPKLAKYFAS